MYPAHQTADGPRGRRALLLGVALLSAIGIGAGRLSLAIFTDQEAVDATFASGSVDLDGPGIDQLTLSVDPMMPGDSINDDVVVANAGSAELRYAVTTASTNTDGKGLRDALVLTVRTVDATTPGTPCDDFDGTVLVDAEAFGALGTGFGDATAGADSGDRTLAPAASETLCFRVELPLATDETYADATTTTTFTFAAEQTTNNP